MPCTSYFSYPEYKYWNNDKISAGHSVCHIYYLLKKQKDYDKFIAHFNAPLLIQNDMI